MSTQWLKGVHWVQKIARKRDDYAGNALLRKKYDYAHKMPNNRKLEAEMVRMCD